MLSLYPYRLDRIKSIKLENDFEKKKLKVISETYLFILHLQNSVQEGKALLV